MGHIELVAPVSHIWYFKGIPRHGTCLRHVPRALEEVIYFASYVVTESGDTPLDKKQLLSEKNTVHIVIDMVAHSSRYGCRSN